MNCAKKLLLGLVTTLSSYSIITSLATVPSYGTAAVNPGLNWSSPLQIDAQGGGINSISCVSSTFCVAVDNSGNWLEYQSGIWSKPTNFDSVPVIGVSCVSSTFCVAIDLANQALVFNGTSWAAPIVIDSSNNDILTSISCIGSGTGPLCIVGDGEQQTPNTPETGYVIELSNNLWSLPVQVDPLASITSVSCASGSAGSAGSAGSGATLCMAVDDQGNALSFGGSTWTKPAAVDPGASITSVSCPSILSCYAVDNYGNEISFNGTAWSTTKQIIHDAISLSSISCPVTTFCAAVGTSLSDPGNVVIFNGTSWAVEHAQLAQDLDVISCPESQVCYGFDGLGNFLTGTSGVAGTGYGFMELSDTGEVYPYGSVSSVGEPGPLYSPQSPPPGVPLNWAAIILTHSDTGYWVVSSFGQVRAYGDATTYPISEPISGTVVAMASTSDSLGYWICTSTGGVYSVGDAVDYGSPLQSGITLHAPIVAMVPTSNGKGYWLLGSDGGVFAYGDAGFYGSLAGMALNAPAVGMFATANNQGYVIAGADGGAFAFGNARFLGSAYSTSLLDSTPQLTPLNLSVNPVISIIPSATGNGYLMVTSAGVTLGFGDAFPVGISASNLPPANTNIISVAGIS